LQIPGYSSPKHRRCVAAEWVAARRTAEREGGVRSAARLATLTWGQFCP
jgi:hypothetical protein